MKIGIFQYLFPTLVNTIIIYTIFATFIQGKIIITTRKDNLTAEAIAVFKAAVASETFSALSVTDEWGHCIYGAMNPKLRNDLNVVGEKWGVKVEYFLLNKIRKGKCIKSLPKVLKKR